MKFTKTRILLIFLLFHSILSAIHNLSNYENFEIGPQKEQQFYYEIKYENFKEQSPTPYLIMSFREEVQFGDIAENTGEVSFVPLDKDALMRLPLSVTTIKKLNIIIKNDNLFPANFIFIDYSKEINLDFETFLNWNHFLKMQASLIPEPIIFNINQVENNHIISFDTTANGEVIHDKNVLLYCINEKDNCKYEELKELAVQKGKKYKFKLNPYRREDELPNKEIRYLEEGKDGEKKEDEKKDDEKEKAYYYYFKPIEIDFYCKEIEFGNNIFEIEKDINELYFIINIKDYEKIYFYVNYNSEYFDYAYINEEQKENIMEELEEFKFREDNTKKVIVNCENADYLLIRINYEYDVYKGSIYITNESYNKNVKFSMIFQDDINTIFNAYGPDSIFMRTSSLLSNFEFNNKYAFGFDEEFYLFTKRLFGNVDVYRLNKNLDEYSNLEELQKPIQSYEINDYELITNQLKIISGYQIFSYFNSYDSLYDVYMQKVNDLEHVKLNQNMFKFDSLVKLFKKGKKYYLDFTVDHYIKLDSKFLFTEVTFTDTKNDNKVYKLNDQNKVIKDLRGDSIIVQSNEDALVYFYKIIPDDSTMIKIEFNKTEYDKIMRLDIMDKNFDSETKLYIIKDFGFMECYPIISENNVEIKNNIGGVVTAYFENYYDKLENNLYEKEEEKYIIYIYDSLNENNHPIFNYTNYTLNYTFYDSFLTIGNKYNFEVISKHFGDQQLLLFSKNKPNITYQFMTCGDNEINYMITNLNWEIFAFDTINKDYTFTQKLNDEETLIHEVISENDSLFAYQFHNPEEENEGEFNKDYSIKSINQFENNILIHFSPVYTDSLVQYHIIIAKADDSNNIDTFSNPCYLANLMTHDSDGIIVKTFYEDSKLTLLSKIIDISEFDFNKNDKIVINIISNNLHSNSEFLTFYKPMEFIINQVKCLSFNIEEKTEFDFDDKSIFKYEYINKNNLTEYLSFNFESDFDFNLLFSDGIKTEEKQFYDSKNNLIEIKMAKSGIYYFQFYNKNSDKKENKIYFVAHIGSLIENEKEEQNFNLEEKKVYFYLPLTKKSEKNEMLLLYYKLDNLSPLILEISGPNGRNRKAFNLDKQEGFKNFLYDKNGTYTIYFKKNEANYLTESNNEIKGIFKMMSTESEFDLDITKKNIEFEEFNIIRDDAPTLKFKVESNDKDYIKKFSILNTNLSEINEIVSIQKKREENKNLNFHYYTFEKNIDYVVNIKFKEIDKNKYTLEKFNITDFSSDNIKEISSSYNKTFTNIIDEFLIIEWKNIQKINITKKNNEINLLIADINESQSKNLAKEFQNIKFEELTVFEINKPNNSDYSVLMVEILEEGAEINIDIDIDTDIDKKDDDDDDKGLSTGYIILISVGCLLVLAIILFFVIRFIRKRKEPDFSKKAQEITEEKLLSDIE